MMITRWGGEMEGLTSTRIPLGDISNLRLGISKEEHFFPNPSFLIKDN